MGAEQLGHRNHLNALDTLYRLADRARLRGILEEAAFLDGAGWVRVFTRVALPNVRHALATVVLLDFVIHWNDFTWPLVICLRADTRTIQLGLGNFFTEPPISWGAILAYATIATVPVTAVFIAGQRWIVASLAGTGTRE